MYYTTPRVHHYSPQQKWRWLCSAVTVSLSWCLHHPARPESVSVRRGTLAVARVSNRTIGLLSARQASHGQWRKNEWQPDNLPAPRSGKTF